MRFPTIEPYSTSTTTCPNWILFNLSICVVIVYCCSVRIQSLSNKREIVSSDFRIKKIEYARADVPQPRKIPLPPSYKPKLKVLGSNCKVQDLNPTLEIWDLQCSLRTNQRDSVQLIHVGDVRIQLWWAKAAVHGVMLNSIARYDGTWVPYWKYGNMVWGLYRQDLSNYNG